MGWLVGWASCLDGWLIVWLAGRLAGRVDAVVGNKFASKWPGALDLDPKQGQAKITAKMMAAERFGRKHIKIDKTQHQYLQ